MTSAPGRATILHADLDAFYASVEQRDDPRLRGRPVIVGGGVVLAASYEAKARGVRTAMGGRQARALCPQAIVVPPRFTAYTEASKAVFEIFRDTTPIVEGISIDEAFLDVGGLLRLSGTAVQIATRLRADVRERVGLPISVGIASTKFLAKVASAVGKPDGLLEVPPGTELAFLHPLPIERLWGVGEVTSRKLRRHGITTVGQIARYEPGELAACVGGASARHLHALALGLDPRRVETGRRRRSIGSQRALGRRPKSDADLEATLISIVDRLGKRLRTAGRVTRTVVLRMRFDDYSRATRSRTMRDATDHTEALLVTARGLLADALPMIHARGITLIGISLTNLENADTIQLSLPFDERSTDVLDHAVDGLRDRFGSASVARGVLIGRSPGMSVPMLPD